jgi:hypothetical protein
MYFRKRSKSKTSTGQIKTQEITIRKMFRDYRHYEYLQNPLQVFDFVRLTSLQLVSLLTIFFNVILLYRLYRTFLIDFSIEAQNQTNIIL